jgi:trehalose synthase-fused probable maltokinase
MEHETVSTPDAGWPDAFAGESKAALEAILPEYLLGRRWFSAKARAIVRVRVTDVVPFDQPPDAPPRAFITFIEVEYAEGDRQSFVLPLAVAMGEQASGAHAMPPQALVTELDAGRVLYDASWDSHFALALLDAIGQDRHFGSAPGQIRAWPTPVFPQLAHGASDLTPRLLGAEQSNTSIAYDGVFILKLFRRLEQGVSPDLEIGRFLTAQGFTHIPPLAGAVEWTHDAGEPRTLAILQGFAPNEGDAWTYTLREVDHYFEQAGAPAPAPPREGHLLDQAAEPVPPAVVAAIGPYWEAARLLGRRTAELHLALASSPADPAFAPESLTMADQRALFASAQRLVDNAFELLEGRLARLPATIRAEAESVLGARERILAGCAPLLDRALDAMRTRVHGDYHLGQILYTGSDFVIIDFEGEPIRSLPERRLKHSPLKDVAGMLRSFHYAAYAALFSRAGAEGAKAALEPWAAAWHGWVSAGFLAAYLEVASQGGFLPPARADLEVLLDAYLLEKAVYELIYELNNRPDWVRIPLQGIEQLAP